MAWITALNFIMKRILLTATACCADADVWVFSDAKYYRDTMERSAGSRSAVGSAELDDGRLSASVNPPTAARRGHQCHFDTTCYHGDGTYVRGACV